MDVKSMIGSQVSRALAPVQTMVGGVPGSKQVLGLSLPFGAGELHDVTASTPIMLAGVAAGAFLGMKKHHPLLGAIVGGSIGRNAPSLTGNQRNAAVANMAQTGAGVAGAMMFHRHPVIGFVLGWLAGGLAVTPLRK